MYSVYGKVPRLIQPQPLAISVIFTANHWLAEGDPVSAVYRKIHTSCADAVDLPLVVGICVFVLPAHMSCCDAVPVCTLAAPLLARCCTTVDNVHAAHKGGNCTNVKKITGKFIAVCAYFSRHEA